MCTHMKCHKSHCGQKSKPSQEAFSKLSTVWSRDWSSAGHWLKKPGWMLYQPELQPKYHWYFLLIKINCLNKEETGVFCYFVLVSHWILPLYAKQQPAASVLSWAPRWETGRQLVWHWDVMCLFICAGWWFLLPSGRARAVQSLTN